MRRIVGISLIFLGVACWVGTSRSGGGDGPRALINQAIKAVGGEDKIMSALIDTWKEKGTYYGMGDGLPYTGTYSMSGTDKFRIEIDNVFTIILNGDKGWMIAGGETKELDKAQLEREQRNHRAGMITHLLIKKDYALSALDPIEVDKKPALGVKVVAKNTAEVKLYFDKQNSLLVKSEFQVFSTELSKDVVQEVFYKNYRAVDGVQMPANIVIQRDGKRFVESENSDHVLGKNDNKLFERPQ